jgi:hypothetical protein
MRIVAIAVLVSAVLVCEAAQPERTQIGHVQGVPVYADQVEGATEQDRADSLHTLFVRPVLQAYTKEHVEEFRVTDEEADLLIERIEAYSECSKNGYELPEGQDQKRFVARFMGIGVKLQAHLHRTFGGGRLLFQQAGVEAFDATHALLKQSEARGDFAITDPALRKLAFDYWTRDHGSFLIGDPAAIEAALSLDTAISKCPAA